MWASLNGARLHTTSLCRHTQGATTKEILSKLAPPLVTFRALYTKADEQPEQNELRPALISRPTRPARFPVHFRAPQTLTIRVVRPTPSDHLDCHLAHTRRSLSLSRRPNQANNCPPGEAVRHTLSRRPIFLPRLIFVSSRKWLAAAQLPGANYLGLCLALFSLVFPCLAGQEEPDRDRLWRDAGRLLVVGLDTGVFCIINGCVWRPSLPVCPSALVARRLAFGLWRLASGVWRLAFGAHDKRRPQPATPR